MAGRPTQSPTGRAAGREEIVSLPDGLSVCYRIDGPENGIPLVMISGLTQDLHAWPQSFVEDLVDRGYRVIRLDNRDTGRSSRSATPVPTMARLLAGRTRADGYELADMAGDVVGLLDQLGIAAAHVVGISMGGMIAQVLAARWPDRVRTLTSVVSTTGSGRVGQPTLATKLMLARRPVRTRAQFLARHIAFTAHLAGTVYPLDADVERRYAASLWARSGGKAGPIAAGVRRHIQAIAASGDRTAELAAVTAPTLVLHGDHDPIVNPSGGVATARAISGARHVVIAGAGHHLSPGILGRLADEVAAHAR